MLPSHVGGFLQEAITRRRGYERGEIFSGFLDVSYRVGLWEFDVTAFG